MTPGDRKELVRTCRRAKELHDKALESGMGVDWHAYDLALADMHTMLTPGLMVELLDEKADDG